MFATPYSGKIGPADEMTPAQKMTFHNGYQTLLLTPGFELWRFVSKQGDNRFGTFWIDPPTMTTIMQTFHVNGNFSEAYKKDVIKNDLAVLTRWSNLSWRVKIRLNKEVISYKGATGTQKQFDEQENILPFGGDEKIAKVVETRIGRGQQFVIPRFRGLSNFNPWATVEVFVHI